MPEPLPIQQQGPKPVPAAPTRASQKKPVGSSTGGYRTEPGRAGGNRNRKLQLMTGGVFCATSVVVAATLPSPTLLVAALLSVGFALGTTLVATGLFSGEMRFKSKVITASGSFALMMALLWFLKGGPPPGDQSQVIPFRGDNAVQQS